MKLTRTQREGLTRIRDKGPLYWCGGPRSRAGGSVHRMFERLAAEGLCTLRPPTITDKGRAALNGAATGQGEP